MMTIKNYKTTYFCQIKIILFVIFLGIVVLGNSIIKTQWTILILFIPLLFLLCYCQIHWKYILLILIIWLLFILSYIFTKPINTLKNFRQTILNLCHNFQNVRFKAINYLNKLYDNNLTSSYIGMLLFNYKTNEIYQIYKNTIQLSIAHLFVVSGLHIQLLLLFFETTILKILKNKRIQNIFCFLLIFVYSYFLFYSISIVRILINYAIKTFKPKINLWNNVTISGIFYLILFKNDVNNYGFLMSFLTTLLVVFLVLNIKNKIVLLILINFFSTLVNLPFIFQMNKKINVFAIFYNFMFSPIVIFEYCWYIIFSWWEPLVKINNFIFNETNILISNNLSLSLFIYNKQKNINFTVMYYFLGLFLIEIFALKWNFFDKNGF